MANGPKDIQRLSPDKLVGGFRRLDVFLIGLAVAIALHVLVTGATSIGYIRDTWIDPEGAEQRRRQELERREREKAAAEARLSPPAPAAPPEAAEGDAEGAEEAPKPDDEGNAAPKETDPMEAHKDAPVVKRVTELPKPGEVPDAPDDIGISIDDTNP